MRIAWRKIFVGILLLGCAKGVAGILAPSTPAAGKSDPPKFYMGRFTIGTETETAEEMIRSRLRDPDSAQFSEVDLYDDRKIDGTPVTLICGHVNAKNGFGGYAGAQQFMVVFRPGPFVAMSGDKGFVKSWNSLCAGTHTVSG